MIIIQSIPWTSAVLQNNYRISNLKSRRKHLHCSILFTETKRFAQCIWLNMMACLWAWHNALEIVECKTGKRVSDRVCLFEVNAALGIQNMSHGQIQKLFFELWKRYTNDTNHSEKVSTIHSTFLDFKTAVLGFALCFCKCEHRPFIHLLQGHDPTGHLALWWEHHQLITPGLK